MEFIKFVRKPFLVEAIEITEENMEELAGSIGTIVSQTDGQKFILVDRKKVPSVDRVYPGYWMTKNNGNIRCYSPRAFQQTFVQLSNDNLGYVRHLNSGIPVSEATRVDV